MTKTFIIIGTSAAGIGAAYRLRMLDASARIICISDEKEIPYNKCFIVEYLSGERELLQVLTLTPESAKQKNIECMLGMRVIRIRPGIKQIELANGDVLSYDALLIATGCSPIMPLIDGMKGMSGIFTFYNVNDVNRIHDFIETHKPRAAVVIGAGLTGLEAADGLMARGMRVHVVERGPHVLPSHISSDAAAVIEEHIRARNGGIHTSVSVTRIIRNNDAVVGVALSDGSVLDADMVICAVGVRPNGSLAFDAGIHMRDGYTIVDEYMQTSAPSVYAAGDVVIVKDQLTGAMVPSTTWPDAMQQGMCAAYAMAGQPKPYAGIIQTVSSSFFGIKIFVCGMNVTAQLPSSYHMEIKKGDGWHHTFLYKDTALKGFVLIGNTNESAALRRSLLTS